MKRDSLQSVTVISIPSIFSSVDWKLFEQLYLDAYQAERPLDTSHLDYYRAVRCVNALVEGAEGLALWRHPLILEDLLECIHSVTGIQVRLAPPLRDWGPEEREGRARRKAQEGAPWVR